MFLKMVYPNNLHARYVNIVAIAIIHVDIFNIYKPSSVFLSFDSNINVDQKRRASCKHRLLAHAQAFFLFNKYSRFPYCRASVQL